MSKPKVINRAVLSAQPDTAVVRYTVAINAKGRKQALRNRDTRRAYVQELLERGHIPAPGCRCSHCLNDWDCCGRMVPGTPRVLPRNGGLYIVQRFDRNI